MNTDYMIRQLDLNKASFEQQLKVKTQEEALFKANADHWCLLQIVCHLVDEEIEDFRIRVKTALDPTLPFIPIDPEGWAKTRGYMEQDYDSKVAEWLAEREKSLYWLQSLNGVNWQSSLQHPDLGQLSAYHFLANWVVHDHIHLRQIMKVKHAYLAHISGQDLSYAGNW